MTPEIAASVLSVALGALWGPTGSALAEGDRRWTARAANVDGSLAEPGSIEDAIRAYEAAHAAEPDALQPRWKLLRALHYLIDFTHAADGRKDRAVDRAVELARESREAIAADGRGSRRDRAQLHFWSAIAWGSLALRAGLLETVREGAATRMLEHAERAVELDPGIERGGSYRLLSRLHADLPRIPFVSGWVSRDRVLPLARQAFAADPTDPGNRLVLALALLERAPWRRAEALDLLEEVAQRAPRPELRAEDLAIRVQAADRLAREKR
jgi:tetratricopeptide (TPR) repeat protein